MSKQQSITSKDELISALEAVSDAQENVDSSEYKYVLYLRKSTDDKDKQVRSLGDQLTECRDYAEDNGIKIAAIVQESVSAKSPDIRPKFRQMLEDIKAGKYQGILSWHPDRLSRNMKDAGEIIDLLDKGVVKDLKFKSFNFENSPSGKMHLGITFVLSKQYSDHLSESVSRGNKLSIQDGKYVNTAPHGYYKDESKFLRADGDNYIIIKNAFQMRLDGKTLAEVADYVVGSGYTKLRKNGKRYSPKINKQTVAKIIANPVYTGVLWYGQKHPIDLTKFYEFAPMVTVEEFMSINELTKTGFIKLSNKFYRPETIQADLLRDSVICDECGESMTAGITPKKQANGKIKKYFYYRCDTAGCSVYGKSTRAKVIVNYVCDYLEKKPFSSLESYKHYEKEMKRISGQRILEAKAELRSLQAKLRRAEERYEKTKQLLLEDNDDELKKAFKGDLKKSKKQQQEIGERMSKVQTLINRGKVSILTYEEFLELMEKMPKTIRSLQNMKDLDYILKKFFLNYTIKEKSVVNTTLNSPFDMLETKNVEYRKNLGAINS